MKIYDKAKWHIDSHIPKNTVIEHFDFIFHWLKEHNMLNENGKEEINVGIDEEISLNSSMLTSEGELFLDKYYDELLREGEFVIEKTKALIEIFINNK